MQTAIISSGVKLTLTYYESFWVSRSESSLAKVSVQGAGTGDEPSQGSSFFVAYRAMGFALSKRINHPARQHGIIREDAVYAIIK
jgi:hypothetical protein